MKTSIHLSDTSIVLTGTIIPNTTLQVQHQNVEARREEYLRALHFYKDFAPTFFLENSSYSLLDDSKFTSIPNVKICQFQAETAEKGKGFQEFQMLDRWVLGSASPQRWVKVTGRYLYVEFEKIWKECMDAQRTALLINQYLFSYADTALFCVDSDFYKRYMVGLYSRCDDRRGLPIEKVLSNRLKTVHKSEFRRFLSHLHCTGIAGHTGKPIQNQRIDQINAAIRDINYKFDRHYIWLSF